MGDSAENDATTCKHCDRPLGGVSGEGSRYYVHTEGSQRGLRTCAITPYGFNAEPVGAECERICNGSRGIEPTTPIPPGGTDPNNPIIHRPGCSWETTPYCNCGADRERLAPGGRRV